MSPSPAGHLPGGPPPGTSTSRGRRATHLRLGTGKPVADATVDDWDGRIDGDSTAESSTAPGLREPMYFGENR